MIERVTSWIRNRTARVGSVTATSRVRTGVEFDRVPPAEWQTALDAVSPLTEQSSGLAVHYETGDRWQPVHRWMLFQLQPWQFVPSEIRHELRGPHPRTNAELVYRKGTVNGVTSLRPSLSGGPCRLIDRRTWELHHLYAERGVLVYPRRFWVIQGPGGGHPWMLDQSDEALRLAQGLPGEVPSAGTLPYAPFDQRVLDAITAFDLWRWANGRGAQTSAVQARIARWTEMEVSANRLRWSADSQSYAQQADELGHLMRKDGMHYQRWQPVGTSVQQADDAELEHTFVHDTTWGD